MSTRRKLTQKKPKSTNPIESLLNKIQKRLKNYCEFWRSCPYFDIESYRCSNAGGSHCGKYRSLKVENY